MSSPARAAARHPDRHAPTSPGVIVGFCHPDHVTAAFCDSLFGVLLHDHRLDHHILGHGGFASVASGPRIGTARTHICDAFLNHPTNPQWLWMVDTDMVFPPDTLHRLLAHADADTHPILGALCFAGGRAARVFPTLYVRTGEGTNLAVAADYPRDALVRVDGTGAACLLIHRTVLERMAEAYPRPYPWFVESVVDGHELGEDLTFCLRAGRLGIPVHVHTGIRVGHMKTQIIDEHAYDTHLQQLAEVGGEAVDRRHAERLGMVGARMGGDVNA